MQEPYILERDEDWSEVVNAPNLLTETLLRWLEGPFAQAPILIILDGFEHLLEPQMSGLHRVHPKSLHNVKALVRAFALAKTSSLLLFTSRIRFTFEDDTEDLSQYLIPVQLGSTEPQEGFKRATARAYAYGLRQLPGELVAECVTAGFGNPELESLLFKIAHEDPINLKEAIDSLKAYTEKRAEGITHHVIKTFLNKIDIKDLLSTLTLPERELLRVVSIFDAPLPALIFAKLQFYIQVLSEIWLPLDTDAIPILKALAETMPQLDISQRLFSLGLLENRQDIVNPKLIATQVHPLVKSEFRRMEYEEFALLAHYIADDLFSNWSVESITYRPPPASMILLSIGLTAKRPQIVTATANDVLVDLFNNQEYHMGVKFGDRTIRMLDNHGVRVPLSLLTMAGRHSFMLQDYSTAASYYNRAVHLLREDGVNEYERPYAAYLLLAHGFLQKGGGFKFSEATNLFEEAVEVFWGTQTGSSHPKDRHSAISHQNMTMDETADRMLVTLTKAYQAMGMVRAFADSVRDRAVIFESRRPELSLSLYRQALELYEELGDLEAQALVLNFTKNILIKMAMDEATGHSQQLTREVAEVLVKLIRVSRAQNDTKNTAVGLYILIGLYVDLGETTKAFEIIPETCKLFSKAETQLLSELNNSEVVITLDAALAEEEIKQGNTIDARERIARYIALLDEQGKKEKADEMRNRLSQYLGN